jgi:hypothetical protein
MHRVLALIVLIPFVGFSQDIVRFGNAGVDARILSQPKDILVCEIADNSWCVYKFRIPEIGNIYSVSGLNKNDSAEMIRRRYNNCRTLKVTGLGIMAGGALITLIAGTYALTGGLSMGLSGGNNYGIVPTITGAAICGVGIILAAAGGICEKKYKQKLKEISFEIRPGQEVTGITLRVNF